MFLKPIMYVYSLLSYNYISEYVVFAVTKIRLTIYPIIIAAGTSHLFWHQLLQ